MESHAMKRQKLANYLQSQYKSGPMYNHALKLSATTVGGQREANATMTIQHSSDAMSKFQKVMINMERIGMNDSNKWVLKAEAQILRPEYVSSVDQLDQLKSSGANNNLVVSVQTEWGNLRDWQYINLHIRGEQAMKHQWRQIEKFESRINKFFKRRTTFLNKYEMIADYKVKPSIRSWGLRLYDALKAYNFWNTRTEPTYGPIQQGQGVIQTTFIIDPITQMHANISVKLPWEKAQIEAMELPTQLRPYPLVQTTEKSTHSAVQLLNRFAVSNQAECSADGRLIQTFDAVDYKAPIMDCYSVLAKDCSDKEPQFVVLVKLLKGEKPTGWKKVKFITPVQSIECQPNGSGRISCTVNGATIGEQESNENEYSTVEYNNGQMSDVTVYSRDVGVSVRFNGRKAWIKVRL